VKRNVAGGREPEQVLKRKPLGGAFCVPFSRKRKKPVKIKPRKVKRRIAGSLAIQGDVTSAKSIQNLAMASWEGKWMRAKGDGKAIVSVETMEKKLAEGNGEWGSR